MLNTEQQQQQNRPQWSRNKSFQGHPPQSENGPSKPLQEKPTVPVSTATKNKLNAFQFGESNPKAAEKTVISLLSDDDKENAEASIGSISRIVQEEKIEAIDEQPVLPTLPTADGPSTPASRLALPDLIGMGDVIRAVQYVSPDERIEWDYDKDNERSSASSFSGIRRAKKRARSSSPVNSSPALASNNFAAKAGTPQIDPGSELWGRYSLNGSNAPTPQGPSVPALAHLMHTSSPQPTKEGTTPRSANGFRRANSCGNQFPKRRRLNGPEDGDVFTESANIGPSKLSVLIERVQEGLTQPQQSQPSIESPRSPHKSGRRCSSIDEYSSPIQQKEHRESTAHPTTSFPHNQPAIDTGTIDQPKHSPVKSNSSDYGEFDDDELDATFLEALEPNPTQVVAENSTASISKPSAGHPQYSPQRFNKTALQPPPVGASKPPSPTKSVDEFGDFDDDMLGDDLEQVLSQFDSKAAVTKPNIIVKTVSGYGFLILQHTNTVIGIRQDFTKRWNQPESNGNELKGDGNQSKYEETRC